jgi:hypothetical protein
MPELSTNLTMPGGNPHSGRCRNSAAHCLFARPGSNLSPPLPFTAPPAGAPFASRLCPVSPACLHLPAALRPQPPIAAPRAPPLLTRTPGPTRVPRQSASARGPRVPRFPRSQGISLPPAFSCPALPYKFIPAHASHVCPFPPIGGGLQNTWTPPSVQPPDIKGAHTQGAPALPPTRAQLSRLACDHFRALVRVSHPAVPIEQRARVRKECLGSNHPDAPAAGVQGATWRRLRRQQPVAARAAPRQRPEQLGQLGIRRTVHAAAFSS